MNGHLNDEQWAAVLSNNTDDTAAQHLSQCSACAEELQSFAAIVGAARAEAKKSTEQPKAFWLRQREGIISRVEGRDFTHPWRRWVWITATMMLILLACTLISRHSVPPTTAVARPDPDDALLLSVQQSIRSDVPQALKPAALLAQEIDRAQIARGIR
jgi:hypothetical protein